MSLPLIIEDIEKRFKISGGTLTGNVEINKSSYPMIMIKDLGQGRRGEFIYNINEEVIISNYKDENNRSLLFLRNENSVNNSLQLSRVVDGQWSNYNIYGEHNKPTASDVGALSLSGGTLTGQVLKLYNGKGAISVSNSLDMTIYNIANDNNNRRILSIYDTASKVNLKDSLLYVSIADGKMSTYTIYGEHNKPVPADIGAPTTTGSGASGTWPISITGSAAKLSSARNIALDGAVTGGATFDGTSAITINTTAKEIYNENDGTKWYHNSIGNSSENGSAWYKLYEVSHPSGYGTYEAYKVSGYIYRHNGNWHQGRTEKIPFIIIINISGDTCEIHSSILYNSNELRVLKKGVRNYEVQYCPNGNHKMFDIYYQITGSGGAGTRYAHGTTATSASSGFITSCTQLTSYGNQAYNSQLVGGYSITHSNASVSSSLTDKKIYLQYT